MRILAGILLAAVEAIAGLVPQPNLAAALRNSDTVIVARVASGASTLTADKVSSAVVLRVLRVLKGDAEPGAELALTMEGKPPGGLIAPNGSWSVPESTGIFFLKGARGKYAVVPAAPDAGEPWRAGVPLPDGAPAGPGGPDAARATGEEIVAALRYLAQNFGPELKPRREAGGGFYFGQRAGEARALADVLATLPQETRPALYRELAAETSPHLRVIGVAGLIAVNDPAGPQQAAAEFRKLSAETFVEPIVWSVMGYSNPDDPEAVRALASLALNENLPNAAYALRAIHTRDAMPGLVALLDSDNAQSRAYALSGVCLFVRNAPVVNAQSVPSMSWMSSRAPAPYRNAQTDPYCWLGGAPGALPESYIGFWKAWWTDHQAEILR